MLARSLLTVALALGVPFAAVAQSPGSYDDRWYLTTGVGANHQDSDRGTRDTATYTLGVGKFVNPRWSVDAELNYQNPGFNGNRDLQWSQYGVSVDARRHWREDGRRWNPYVLMGVGYQRSEEEFDRFPSPLSPGQRTDGFASAKLGAGLQGDFRRVSVRGEIYARTDFDRGSVNAPGERRFTDGVAAVSLVVPLGERRADPLPAPVVPAPPAPPIVEAPPAPPAVTALELPAVYFAFDQARLSEAGREALAQAAAVLRDNPGWVAVVNGHTDNVGSRAYNQRLSERRARVAYDHLLDLGVDPQQLRGPVGFGEDRPAAPNAHPDGSDDPAGRALNRRTELEPIELL